MSFRVLGTNHWRRRLAFFREFDQGPNKGRKVVYVRDWDGVTLEFIEVATK